MAAKRWKRPDLVRASGESSSVVSQWLGKGSKTIKSIGKLEAAEALERASGFAALWIAKGKGPKFPPAPAAPPGGVSDGRLGTYTVSPLQAAVTTVSECLAALAPAKRDEAVAVFTLVAKHPERATYAELLVSLLAGELEQTRGKRHAAGR